MALSDTDDVASGFSISGVSAAWIPNKPIPITMGFKNKITRYNIHVGEFSVDETSLFDASKHYASLSYSRLVSWVFIIKDPKEIISCTQWSRREDLVSSNISARIVFVNSDCAPRVKLARRDAM